MGNGRLPQDTAARGLTNRFWPRNFKEPQLEDKRENDLRMSQTRPGRDALRDGKSRTGLADGRSSRDFVGWVRHGPVIRIYHGPGQERSARLGLAVPHSRELTPPAKTVGFEMSEFLQFETVSRNATFLGFFR